VYHVWILNISGQMSNLFCRLRTHVIREKFGSIGRAVFVCSLTDRRQSIRQRIPRAAKTASREALAGDDDTAIRSLELQVGGLEDDQLHLAKFRSLDVSFRCAVAADGTSAYGRRVARAAPVTACRCQSEGGRETDEDTGRRDPPVR